MSRLDACFFVACVLLSCCHLTSSNSLKSFLQRKRNSRTVVPHENTGTGSDKDEEIEAEYEYPQQYTPDAFPPCVSLEYLTVLKDRFSSQIDKNNDGKATFEEMRRHLEDYNKNVRNKTVLAFIRRRDLNGDGIIDFVPEYLTNVIVPDYTEANAREWFSLDDTNGDGVVTKDELMAITRQIGTPEPQAEQQVSVYYFSNDKNRDGKLSWDEYKVIYGQGNPEE